MKKQLKVIGVLFGVFAVLLAGYFILRPLLAENEPTENAEFDADGDRLGTSGRPYLYDPVELSDLASVYVHNETGEYRFNMDSVAGSLVLEGHEELPFRAEKLSYLYVNTCHMLAMTKVEQPSDDLAEYGLEKGRDGVYFEVTTTDGATRTVYIGDKLPTGAAYYCKCENKPYIYVIDTMIEQCVLADASVYVAPLLATPVPENDRYGVSEIKIVKDGELFVSFDRVNPEEAQTDGLSISHGMTYPAGYNVSQSVIDDILGVLVSLAGDAVIDECVSADELVKAVEDYGFAKPSHELLFTYDGEERRVIFGKETEDGSGYYALNPKLQMICTVPKKTVEFIDFDLIRFIDKYIFQMNIDSVDTMQVTTKKHKETFTLSGEKKELSVTRGEDATPVDTYQFRQFFIDVLLITLDDYASAPEEPSEVLSYKVTTRGGDVYDYRFYDLSTRKVYFTVNGSGQFYANRDDVDRVISNLDKLLRGEEFLSDALK